MRGKHSALAARKASRSEAHECDRLRGQVAELRRDLEATRARLVEQQAVLDENARLREQVQAGTSDLVADLSRRIAGFVDRFDALREHVQLVDRLYDRMSEHLVKIGGDGAEGVEYMFKAASGNAYTILFEAGQHTDGLDPRAIRVMEANRRKMKYLAGKRGKGAFHVAKDQDAVLTP